MGNDLGVIRSGTLAAYERGAARYIERTGNDLGGIVGDLIEVLAPGSLVLELGSGPGRDALALEAAGLTVDRTDGARSFVDLLRVQGHRARVLDVHAEHFGGPYDAVFANAVLLHVERDRLQGVLRVAARATKVGGVLAATFKKGDGEGWSRRKLEDPRYFTYWREEPLRRVLLGSGWAPLSITDSTAPGASESWITVLARAIHQPEVAVP